jgi:hypothetical protein
MKKIIALIGAMLIALSLSMTVADAATKTDEKPWICHPVNGNGELGNGWNLINPNKASSHIDESLYPNGVYWKHESKDGRHDVYADGQTCPGPVVEPTDDPTPTPPVVTEPPVVNEPPTTEPGLVNTVKPKHHENVVIPTVVHAGL